jgi:opacity protein-like surface antigen
MIRGLLLGLALLAATAAAHSQQPTATPPATAPAEQDGEIKSIRETYKGRTYFGVGLQAGLSTGMGITFSAAFPSRLGAEMTVGYLGFGDVTLFSIGAEGQYFLDDAGSSRLYALLGGGYYYAITDTAKIIIDGKESERTNEANGGPGAGRLALGLGYEWAVSEKMTISLEIPITLFIGGPKTNVYPIPQLSMLYYFR